MGIAGRRRRNGRPGQPPRGHDRIAAARSWLVNCVIEGFAAYGHTFCPSVTGTGETENSREEQRNQKVHGRDDFALSPNNPWPSEDLRKSAEQETRPMVPATETRNGAKPPAPRSFRRQPISNPILRQAVSTGWNIAIIGAGQSGLQLGLGPP